MATITYKLDPANLKGLSDETLARLDAMTPEEIEANALSDPDNPPSTEEEMLRGVFGRAMRLARKATGLTHEDFARTYFVDLDLVRDAEDGRLDYDRTLVAYLALIEHDPQGARRTLEAASTPRSQAA